MTDPTHVPEYLEPLLAFRYWDVEDIHRLPTFISFDLAIDEVSAAHQIVPRPRPPEWRLTSRCGSAQWTPYERLEATHLGQINPFSPPDNPLDCPGSPCDGHIPHQTPKCGIYGFKSAAIARDQMAYDFRRTWRESQIPTIIGAVWLWGRIVEHEHGYRAQYAYPAHFAYSHKCDPTALAATYGVPYQEDLSWKSVFQSDESLQSHSRSQYLGMLHYAQIFNQTPIVPLNIQKNYQLSSSPSQRSGKAIAAMAGQQGLTIYRALFGPWDPNKPPSNWSSSVITHPNDHAMVIIPDPKPIESPKPRIHQPRSWFWDAGVRLWRRLSRQPQPAPDIAVSFVDTKTGVSVRFVKQWENLQGLSLKMINDEAAERRRISKT